MIRAALIMAAVGGIAVLSAQVPAPAQSAPAFEVPTFEVASVRPSTAGAPTLPSGPRPGGYAASNAPLRSLIVYAYGVRPSHVVGGPDWITADRFDVTARAPEGAPANQIPAMVAALLAERFKLVVHKESREEAIYTLVAARQDGAFGPRFTPSSGPCAMNRKAGAPTQMAAAPNGERMFCGFVLGTSGEAETLKGRDVTIAALTNTLTSLAGRPVIDRTGIQDRVDVDLRWKDAVSTTPSAVDDAPSLFTALAEQLGLRLEPGRGPIEVLVIDSVAQPTAN